EKHSTNLTNESIDLSNQASGMYFVDVIDNGKEVWFKVVKE
ncbi:T9SS type A sorting domain-containing protein, partial [Flavobacterium sp.]